MTDPTPVDPAAPVVTPPPAAPAPAASTTWTPPESTNAFVYADVPNRAIAYIIDAIIVGILTAIIGAILGSIGLAAATIEPGTVNVSFSVVGVILSIIVGSIISAGYFIYTWTNRATIGMRILGMQIGNAGDGKTITTDQGIRRWLAIAAPSLLAQIFFPLPLIGFLLAIASLAWFVFLVYSTAKSPTKQGWHDVFANTQVVKAARSA